MSGFRPKGPPNGPSGPGPGPRDAMAAAQAEVAQMIGAMVMALTSNPPQPQKVLSMAAASIRQQESLGAILDDATVPEKRIAHPEWGVKVRHPKLGEGVIRVPKDFSACESLDQVMHFVTLIGLITNPTPRALLLAQGFEVEFFQAGPSKRIVTA